MNTTMLEQYQFYKSSISKPPIASISDQETILNLLIALVSDSPVCKLLKLNNEQMINEVVFESDLDGVHYYIVKSVPKPSQNINLSPREESIAKLVAQGLSNKSIAIQLNLSPWTVATYLRRIFSKLGVTSRTAMITRLFKESVFDNLELREQKD